MSKRMGGFGLIETLLALVLGLVMTLALTQLFISTKSSYLSQSSSAALQEEARFTLARMAQDIRLVGVPGCLQNVRDETLGGRFSSAVSTPVHWDARQQSLTLVGATLEGDSIWHQWVIHTDCRSSSTVWSRGHAPVLVSGEMALPVQQHVYRFNASRNELSLNGQPLLSHVREFSVLFGEAASQDDTGVARYTAQPDPALIRSVRLTLTLQDPADRVQERTFHIVAAIRNRLG